MSATSVPEKIAEIAKGIKSAVDCANSVSGKGDATLLDAVATLAAGYTGDIPLELDSGTVDLTGAEMPLEFDHSLGVIPKCLLVYPENEAEFASNTATIVFVFMYNSGIYEVTDYEDRELTGENAKYKYTSKSTVGSIVYRDAIGILKTVPVLPPEVSATTEDGVEFAKGVNKATAFIPAERGGKYAKAVYRWVALADKE